MHRSRNNDSCDRCVTDHGPDPFTVPIDQAVCRNSHFRTALWTGCHLQLTLMCIPAGGEIGLEQHPDTDQFLCLVSGNGLVKMGDCRDKADFERQVCAKDAVFVPAGTWHNMINTGCEPLRLYSVYAPPQHPRGTVHRTKAAADAAEDSK